MTAVPEIRRLWALIREDGAGVATLALSAREPTPGEVAKAAGVLMLTGMLKDDGASLSLPIVGALPHVPRYDLFTAVSQADGVAAVAFDPPFAAAPKAVALATPNLLTGPVRAEIVAGSLSKTGCRVKVTAAALTTGIVAALAGATVTVIAIGG